MSQVGMFVSTDEASAFLEESKKTQAEQNPELKWCWKEKHKIEGMDNKQTQRGDISVETGESYFPSINRATIQETLSFYCFIWDEKLCDAGVSEHRGFV